MARFEPTQTTFTSGELSPRLEGRVDLAKYFEGVKTLENALIHPHGGVSRRSGFRYVATGKTSGKAVRLVPFEFSTVQAYILEFGHKYIRFYRNEGQIVDADDAIVEITTTYGEGELNDLKFAQSADTLYIVHRNHAPAKLTRTSSVDWTLSDISFTANPFSAGNYPQAVALYEERSVWAGPDDEPQTIFFSKTGNFENMTTGTADDDGMEFTISTDQVNRIRWMSPGDTLIIGTVGGEFEAHGSTPDTPITPTSVQINRQTAYGCANIQPIRIGAEVLFIQRSKRKMRSLVFNFDSNGFVAPDVSVLSEHVTKGGITQLAFQQEPDSIVWMVRADGELVGLTYDRDQEIIGWHRHPATGTSAAVESVAVIPAPDGSHDQLWISVKRTVNGSVVRHIEFMEEEFDDGDDKDDAFFVDSGLTYSGTDAVAAVGFVELTGGGSGSIDTLTVNGEDIIGDAGVAFDTDLATTASNLADAIDDYPSVPNYTGEVLVDEADNNVAFVKITAADAGTGPNGYTIAGTSTTITVDYSPLPVGYVDLTGGASGSVDSITVNGVEIMSGAESFDTNLNTTAGNVASNITANTSSPDYNATASGSQIIIRGVTADSSANGFAVVSSATTITTLDQDMDGGGDGTMADGTAASAAAITTVTGLDHLEGETVQVLADGATHPDKTVSSGQIVLDRSASDIHVGLAYQTDIQTLRLDMQGQGGVGQGKKGVRIHKVYVRFWNTLGGYIGPDASNLDEIYFRGGSDPMDASPPVFTGDKEQYIEQEYGTESRLYIRQTDPLPMTVLALFPAGQVN